MKFWMLLLIPAIAFSIGCGKPIIMGTPIDKAKVEQLVPGTTSEAKVKEIFGQPEKTEMVSGGVTKYTYSYYEEQPRIFRKNVQIKHVLDVYTQKGVVQKYDLKREGVEDK
ncbi:MAG: outer membrane protein assembly factor BamE [Syntrophaceae bacterium]|jgi:outer membrane protein assembly factor BamE (lipoprotein component of BamABCDE complex)|nr:outer membrane protein assembly factor BamE [Syntrophaceae bacterium]